jgi:hypothetical protein
MTTLAGDRISAEDELEKLESYFAEGRKLWQIDPERVISKSFFELWEEVRQPLPFYVETLSLSILDQPVQLVEDVGMVGAIDWDGSEECAAFQVEGKSVIQRWLLMFQDGDPLISDQAAIFKDSDELTYGERLEYIFDIIAWFRENESSTDVLKLSKREYLDGVASVASLHEKRAVQVMKRLSLKEARKLIDKAVEDMAEDELSDQLILPLDGSYAVASNASAAVVEAHLPDTGPISITLPQRTSWMIIKDLDFMFRTADGLREFEESFVLTFEGYKIIRQISPLEMVIKVPVEATTPISERDRLPVFARGENRPIAEFNADFHDGAYVVGRFIWSEMPDDDTLTGRVFARPRRSPAGFIAESMCALLEMFKRDRRLPSPVLETALGVRESQVELLPAFDNVGNSLDESQRQALRNSVDSETPIILIQGPPGTGKTHVLEAVIRDFVTSGKRVLMTAPSNAAVDNVCRRIVDLPALRLGRTRESIAPELRDTLWIENRDAIMDFKRKRQDVDGSVYCGTHVGVLRDQLTRADLDKNGLFDVIIFDEAGMSRLDEWGLCVQFAERAILFGDHRQLPPFPLSEPVIRYLTERGPATEHQWTTVQKSALEWLITEREFPVNLLASSYRCQNPRLMRFSSTLFYDARVKASACADYYQLSYRDRQEKYPASTLRFYSTSKLPLELRGETMIVDGGRPGMENQLEAALAVHLVYRFLANYPLREVTVIAPYRRQVRLIRNSLTLEVAQRVSGNAGLSEADWKSFLFSRISTVDSFQGGESDVVIICYVRSNEGSGIGFVDDAHRVNVAHTRCRREMHVIGDLECLKDQCRERLFQRMEQAMARDGEIVDVSDADARQLLDCPAQ